MTAVVVLSHPEFGGFLPSTTFKRAGGVEYRLYDAPTVVDSRYTDPFDGTTLIEVKGFPDELLAKSWVEADIFWRRSLKKETQ